MKKILKKEPCKLSSCEAATKAAVKSSASVKKAMHSINKVDKAIHKEKKKIKDIKKKANAKPKVVKKAAPKKSHNHPHPKGCTCGKGQCATNVAHAEKKIAKMNQKTII